MPEKKKGTPCPDCKEGSLNKFTRPINVKVFVCDNCGHEFTDEFIEGYLQAKKENELTKVIK